MNHVTKHQVVFSQKLRTLQKEILMREIIIMGFAQHTFFPQNFLNSLFIVTLLSLDLSIYNICASSNADPSQMPV